MACLQLQLGTRQPTVAPRRPQWAHFISRPRLMAASTFRSVPLSVSNTCLGRKRGSGGLQATGAGWASNFIVQGTAHGEGN